MINNYLYTVLDDMFSRKNIQRKGEQFNKISWEKTLIDTTNSEGNDKEPWEDDSKKMKEPHHNISKGG